MSYELPVTYLQTVPLPQLPLSTAGLPSQTTGVSQVPLTVMAVAHIFLIPENERNSSSAFSSSTSFNNPSYNSPSPMKPNMITNDEPVTKRRRVTLVIDPIASYTKDLDVAVARCVAASGVTSLRFQNEQSLFGLRTSLHPLDIIVSHSSPADCIRVLPSLLPWYKPMSNVLAATDSPQGWKAVIIKSGQPPLPATFKLQHEMPQDHTWYVDSYFSLTPADDPEQGSHDWMQMAHNATPIRNNNNNTFTSASPSRSTIGDSSTYFSNGGRPPLGPMGTNNNNNNDISMSSNNGGGGNGSVMSPLRASSSSNQQDIAWLLPHAKKDGGASERAAASLLTHERNKGEVTATQLEMVKTSLEAEKAASKSQKMAYESENAKLNKRIKDLENELRNLRIERVATADSVQQLTYALHHSNEEKQSIQDTYRRQQDGVVDSSTSRGRQAPEKLQTEPLMMSRPEALGPLPTSMQNTAAGPSDAEVLASLMIQSSLKPSSQNQNQNQQQQSSGNTNNFSSASASPFPHHHQQSASLQRRTYQVGQRGPSPITKRNSNNNNNVSFSDENNNTNDDATAVVPPSPLVIESALNTSELPQRPAWNNILGDTPEDRNLDPYGLTNSETAFSEKDKKEHSKLVRSLLVKNALPSQMEKMGSNSRNRNNNNYASSDSGYSSRSATPTRSLENNNNYSRRHETTSANYKQQANANIRSGGGMRGASPNSARMNNNNNARAASPLMADQSRVQATTASLHNLSNHIKAGRKLIQDLRN